MDTENNSTPLTTAEAPDKGVGTGDLLGGLMAAIRNDPELGPRFREIDKIEAEATSCVDCVDLDIAFSPVLMHEGDAMRDAVEVAYKGADGRYVFDSPFKLVTAEELRVMRARYLVMRGKEMEPAMRRFFSSPNGPGQGRAQNGESSR